VMASLFAPPKSSKQTQRWKSSAKHALELRSPEQLALANALKS